MGHPHVRRELALELRHLGAEHELPGLEDAVDGPLDLGLDGSVLSPEVYKGNHCSSVSAPPCARDFSAASSTRITRRPDSPSVTGRLPVRTQSTKCCTSTLSASPTPR